MNHKKCIKFFPKNLENNVNRNENASKIETKNYAK